MSARKQMFGLLVAVVAGSVLAALPARAANAPAAPASRCGTTNPQNAYPPSSAQVGLSTTVYVRGGKGVLTGRGYAPSGTPGAGGTVTLTLCSSPLSLGTTRLRADGSFSTTITIPDNAALGQHHVYASGPDGKGGTLVLATRLTVTASLTDRGSGVGGSGIGSTSTGSSQGGLLPFTGTQLAALLLAGAVALLLGTALVRAGRRRRLAH
jgi:hypothetical protein